MRLVGRYRRSLTDTAAWCQVRAEVLAEHRADLARVWAVSPLRAVRAEPTAGAAAGVLVDHPSYARIAHIAGRLLSPRFALARQLDAEPDGGDAASAPVRPSYDLYELWTFLLVRQPLAAALPGWDWDRADLSPLERVDDTGAGAYVAARGGGGRELELLFNQPFPAMRKTKSGTGLGRMGEFRSLSSERRPDITVRMRGPDGAAWVVLDAKYYKAGGLKQAMEKLHIYRDALWMEDWGGRCRGGLLAPSCGTRPWALPTYRDRFDIGVWECPPGMDADPALGAWIARRLGLLA